MSRLHVAIANACRLDTTKEACGVIDGYNVVPLKNCSSEPESSFMISAEDFLKYEPNTIYHSHPTSDNGFSEHDLVVAANLQLTSYVYVVESDRLERFTPTKGVEVFENVLSKS